MNIRSMVRLLRRVAFVSDPVTATILVGGAIGAGLGIWGATQKNKENQQSANNALDLVNAQNQAAIDAANQKVSDTQAQAGAQFAYGTQKTANADAQGNEKIAEDVAKASSAEGATLAQAGMSGVKLTGSMAEKQSEQQQNDARTISDETQNLNAGVQSDINAQTFSRDSALTQANNLAASYAVGGDEYNILQQRKNDAQDAVDNADDPLNQALSIATGAFQGASSGLSMGKDLSGLFATPAAQTMPTGGWGLAGADDFTDFSGYRG